MSFDSGSGIGATASMRDLTISASTPAASALATLGGVRMRSIWPETLPISMSGESASAEATRV